MDNSVISGGTTVLPKEVAMQQVKGEAYINKLIMLFVFDKMEGPLTEKTLLDVCPANKWLEYMDCVTIINQLVDCGFIYRVNESGEPLYAITVDGRMCLANYYVKIPTSTREEIAQFATDNAARYRMMQEAVADYYKNKDGTYTVLLKIIEPTQPLLELKLSVPTKQIAKSIHKSWKNRFSDVYSLLYENLVD